MPKRVDPAIVGGLLLILVGALYLLNTMGLLQNVGDVFWGIVFLAAGALFLFVFFTGSWWAVIPGFALAGIGALILLPPPLEDLGGAIFLGALALAFWLVCVTAPRQRWWAIIPGGVLTTLAVVTLLPEVANEKFVGSFFFFGLAATFLLVALFAKFRWAWYPAAILAGIGLVVLLIAGEAVNYVWAAALIVGGGYLVFRAIRPPASQ